MSGFELFGSTRARTCVISALDHYPHNSFDDGFQFNRSSRDSHFAIDRDISSTYCWLSSNGVDRDLLCGTVSKRSTVGASIFRLQ